VEHAKAETVKNIHDLANKVGWISDDETIAIEKAAKLARASGALSIK
jgi:hypothetical protein